MAGPIRPPDVFCPQTQHLQTSGQRVGRPVFFHRCGTLGRTRARDRRGPKGAEGLLRHALWGGPGLEEAGFGWGVGLTQAHANAHTCKCMHTERGGGGVWIPRLCRLGLPETGRVLLGPKNARQQLAMPAAVHASGQPGPFSVGDQCQSVAAAAAGEHGRISYSENSGRRIEPGLDI